MNGELWPSNGRSARVIEVIEVVTKEGDNAHGTLVREVTRYYTLDGELLATRDPAPPWNDTDEPARQCGQNVFDDHQSGWNARFVNHSIDVGDFSKHS